MINTKNIEKSKVCVILPINNYSKYMDDAINSILNQTYDNIEIVVIIEKTKDQKKIKNHIVKKYKNKNIVLLLNKINLGLARSLNKGLNYSNGEFVARMDIDDISISDRIERQVNYLKKHKDVGILGSNAEYFGKITGPWFSDDFNCEKIKVDLLIGNPICHPTIIIRKSIIDKYRLKYNKNYISEDYELWCTALTKGIKIELMKDILLYYRKSDENITSNKKYIKKREKSVIRSMKKYYKKTLKNSFSTDEIMNLQGIFPCEKNEQLRKKTTKKIIDQNQKNNFFDDDELKYYLNYY